MIISPLQNTPSKYLGSWIQKRPFITQTFGENPQIYDRFGMMGHNGTDFRAAIGTPIFAPFDGQIKIRNSHDSGYGLHIKIRSREKRMECVLAHLSKTTVSELQDVNTGDIIGFSGNTGFSTGPHLHFGVRSLKYSSKNVWDWKVENYENGYLGYWNIEPYTLTWKGSLLLNNI